MELDTITCMDALQYLAGLPDSSVDLIVTDPPYNGVKDDAWDNQWRTDNDFLAWMNTLCQQWQRVLKANGSLYVFASPRLGSRVELKIAEHFNLLNRITWKKPPYSTKAEMFDKDTMRCFFPASEVIIFAEKRGADRDYQGALVTENSSYWQACETAKRGVFGDYLKDEFARAGVTRRQIAALFPSASGGLTGCVSNWLIGYNCPTPEQYQKMRDYLNNRGDEFMRRQYEDLRRQYEDLRRPFHASANAPYTDVWEYRTVNNYAGKHPAEKPVNMIKHIIRTSSNHGAVVLDCFVGSGAILDAARQLGRRFIGCDFDPHWVKVASKRVSKPIQLELIPEEITTAAVNVIPITMPQSYTLSMFA